MIVKRETVQAAVQRALDPRADRDAAVDAVAQALGLTREAVLDAIEGEVAAA